MRVSTKHKKEERHIRLMRKATKCMGGDLVSTSHFVHTAIVWLAHELGDLHIQMMKCDGWQVATCFEDLAWSGWIEGSRLEYVLAKAVIQVESQRGGTPQIARAK